MSEPNLNVYAARICPNCGGDVHFEETLVCQDCSLVVEESVVDRGRDWTQFNEEAKRHSGSAQSAQLHDGGLSTTIGNSGDWQRLDPDKRRRLSRQQTYHSRAQAPSKVQRNRRYTFGQIKRIVSALDAGSDTADTACQLFGSVQDQGLTVGRNLDALAPACVFIALRQTGAVRHLSDIAERAHCDSAAISRCRFDIQRALTIEIPLVTATDHLPTVFDALDQDIGPEARQHAFDIAEQADTSSAVHGSPSGIAGATVYQTLTERGQWTQAEVATAAGCCSATIRSRLEALAQAEDVTIRPTPSAQAPQS